jgi:NitT/TauT family transport system permease protein
MSGDRDLATSPPESLGEPASDQVATHSRRRQTGRKIIFTLQIAVAAIGLGLWQILTSYEALDPFYFGMPSEIGVRLWEWVSSGFIWPHLMVTLVEATLAFIIGTILGIAFGVIFARVRLLGEIFSPYIKIFNALPRVILGPMFLLWFGLGIWSKVALGVTIVFFVVFFNTYQGIKQVDAGFLNNARMLQASDRQLVRYVYIPSAMAWIFSSLHTSIGFALVAAVVGEYLGSSRGIGYIVAQAQGVFDTTGVMAGLVLTSAVVVTIDFAIERVERYLLRWKPTSDH